MPLACTKKSIAMFLSMRSVKSSNAVFHSKTVNSVDDQQRSSTSYNAGEERYDDTVRVERQNKNVISLISARNSQISDFEDVYVNTDEDVMEHLSKDKISIPNVFESSSQYTRNITDVVSHSKNSISILSEVAIPKIKEFSHKSMGEDNTRGSHSSGHVGDLSTERRSSHSKHHQ